MGAYKIPLFFSLLVCVTFVVLTDFESCKRPISTNLGSMKAGEYGVTRETCFVARRLEVVAVAGLLWISLCVLGAAGFRFFFVFFFVERTRSSASMMALYLFYVMRQGRGSEAAEPIFCLYAKTTLHTGVRTWCHYLIRLSVRLPV